MSAVDVIGFAALSLVVLASAVMVVTSSNLVHCVLFLAVTLISTAGLYLHLQADFLAAVQVLLYAGGVITLMLFAVMLTRKMTGGPIQQATHGVLWGATVAGVLMFLFGYAIWRQPLPLVAVGTPATPQVLGRSFLTTFMLPFEVLSLLLVVAMVGAIVLARKEDA
jgi:NADH-quinone oxidoreductase subunit J